MSRRARSIGLLCVLAVVALTSGAGGTDAPGGVPLPIRKVMLYKNGMGYFEHLGDVRGAVPVEITFSSAQLNDVLKSLIVLDLAPAPVVAVTYDTTKSVERQLAELPIRFSNFTGIAGFLSEIRGTEVELDVPGGPITGRLMTADVRKKELAAGGSAEVVEVTIFVAGGQLRTVEIGSAKAIRVRGTELTAGIGRYLDVLETAHRRDVRRLRIQTRAEGTRKLFVGYTSEAPIWKTTYRLVLDDTRKPLLQGWAIVDNATGMDWDGVELTLVAGAPISFIQKLSEPVYARRPEVPLTEEVGPAPRLYAPALVASAPPPTGATGRTTSMDLMAPRQALEPVAEGRVAGEQFEYRIPQPVTLARDHSAMLPIVHAEVEGEKVAVWTGRATDTIARAGIWLTNTSGLTLAPGAFTVIDAGGFAGEGLTDTIHPAERRVLSYGRDLAVSVVARPVRQSERIERVVVRDGVIRWHVRRESEVAYRVTSQHGRPRTVLIEHPIEPSYVLAPSQAPTPVESTAGVHRFRLVVAPRSTTDLTVLTQKPEQTTIAIDSRLTRDKLTLWLRERRIDAAMEQAVARVVEAFEEVQRLGSRGTKIDEEVKRIFTDQERVRENLAKLGQGPDESALRLRYVQQLAQQETRLEALRVEKVTIDSAQADAEKRVDKLVKDLVIDRAL